MSPIRALRELRPPVRIRSRRALVGVALVMQAVILAVGWSSSFLVVRDTFARSIEDRIVAQNSELAARVASLLPGVMGSVEFGSPEWERLQSVIEGLDELPAGGFACLLDEDGNILCHPDIREQPGIRNINLADEVLETSGGPDGSLERRRLDEFDAPASGRVTFAPGNTHYVATDVIDEAGHRLVVHQPVADLVDAGRTSTRVVIASAVCTGMLVLGLAGGGLLLVVRSYEAEIESVARRLQGEIDLAHDIQQGTLPSAPPVIEGFDVAGWSDPAEETGGDTWDAFTTASGDAVLMLADATGHGVGPALSVTQLRSMVRIAAQAGGDLAALAETVNTQLHADLPADRFITAWLARLDPAAARLEVVSAGQGPILRWIEAERRVEIEPADTWPLGVMGDLGGPTARTVDLAPGDMVVVVSDGIIEEIGAGGDAFGTDRTAALVAERAAARDGAGAVAEAIRAAAEAHSGGRPAADDRTVLVLRRPPAAI